MKLLTHHPYGSSTVYAYNGQFYTLNPGDALYELPGGLMMVQQCPCLTCDSLRQQISMQTASGNSTPSWYLPGSPPQASEPEQEPVQLPLPYEDKWFKLKASGVEFKVINVSGDSVTIRKRNERDHTTHEIEDLESASNWKRE